MTLMLVVSLSAMANNGKVTINDDRDVTITKENRLVQVSILNIENATYNLDIYNPTGELVFEGTLGNEASIGKLFDFKSAIKGEYTFTFTNDAGERFSYMIKTGSVR